VSAVPLFTTETWSEIAVFLSYKYSVTGNKNTAISDQVSVVNSGTADTPLIVEARAIKQRSVSSPTIYN
jgi:NCAIR mutase (PurE)-related protein